MQFTRQWVGVAAFGGAMLFASAAAWAAPVELSAALPQEMKAVVDAFNAKQSAIHVQFLPTPERSDKTLAQLLGGTGPDIQYIGWYEDIDKFIDAGVFQSLTPFINNDGAGNLVADIPKPVIDRFSRNGQLMGIPEYTHMRAVGINRTYRENAGLALPNSDWDWAAFEAYAKKL
ncbi:MAG TPA: extracellular solute-binding protein, partial [Limnochordia bacterium]|nr:extracellular solute-binding protein [Limnochordia bacterium]